MNELKTAACYIRVSTDDQLDYSPDSQLSAIQSYAKQNGFILCEDYIFIEHEGISGRNAAKRPEFQRMIGIAKQKPKPFDVLLLWKYSRFARNREDSIVYKSMLRKQCGIDVLSVSEPVGDDKMSVIFESMIEAMDEYYSLNLAEEVKRGMTEAAKRGQVVSIAPYGYTIIDKKLVVAPDKADIIREVYARYLNGQAIRSITVWLNSIGIKTRYGNPVDKHTVEYWLNNPAYNGYIRWTPTGRAGKNYHNPDSFVVKGEHEPIISDDVWNAVQEKLATQKAKYSRYTRSAPSDKFTLSGIVRCAYCGSPMGKSTYRYMQCSGYRRGICTSSQVTSIATMTQMLMITLEKDLANGTFTASYKQNTPLPNTNAITKQIERITQKLSRAKQAYLDGIDSAEEYRENKIALQTEIKRLQSELEQCSGNQENTSVSVLSQSTKSVLELLRSDASDAEKNAALKNLIEKAVFDKSNKTLQIFYH